MHGQAQMQTLLAIGVVSSLFAVGGCVSYTNVSGPESPPSFRSPNHYAAVDVTGTALDWVLRRHGPTDDGGYVVNLPAGTTQQHATEIFEQLPSGAAWPVAMDQDPSGMFHVGRVWIRASEAKVDIVYPFTTLSGTTSQRGVTVWLQGGVRNWRAIRGQYWAPGTVVVPPVAVPWNELAGEDPVASPPPSDSRSQQALENAQQSEMEEQRDVSDQSAYQRYEPVIEREVEQQRAVQPRTEPASAPSSSGSADPIWREVPVGDS